MPARVHIVCGLTVSLLDRFRAALPAALWLGPTRRAVARHPYSPGMWTIADFADDVVRRLDPETRPLSAAQRRLVADDVVQELYQQGELKHFGPVCDTRGFAEGLTNLLAELERLGVTPSQFSQAAKHSTKERECAGIYARYLRELHRLHLLDPDGRTARAAALLRDKPFDVKAVFLDGFTDFTAVQYDLIDALCARVEEMWIALPDDADDERDELFRVPRETLRRLRDRLSPLTPNPSPRSTGERGKMRRAVSPTSPASYFAHCGASKSPMSPMASRSSKRPESSARRA